MNKLPRHAGRPRNEMIRVPVAPERNSKNVVASVASADQMAQGRPAEPDLRQTPDNHDPVATRLAIRQNRGSMKHRAKKWLLFVLRWGVAVAGIWWVISNMTLRDRVTIVDEHNR